MSYSNNKGYKQNPIAEIKNLTCRYRESQIPVLRNINLELYPGELVLVTGPSGCGKSTLALCLNGLIPHFIGCELDGSVVVAGMNTLEHPVSELAKKVGIVFQDPESQLCNLYVKNEIAFGCENLLLPVEIINKRIDYYASLFDLVALKNSLCAKLSVGQKQRVALASVLSMEPQLLILDEPTSNLDNLRTCNTIRSLRALRDRKEVTVLIIEHKIDEIIDMVDRVILMNDGQVVLQGTPREVYEKHSNSIRSEMGVWVPQVVEFALELRKEKGLTLPYLPITVDDGYKIVKDCGLKLNKAASADSLLKNNSPIFVVEDVSHVYDRKIKTLEEINLTINQGETIAIIGPNGSGKTTLGKIFVGLLKPSQGRLFYRNDELASIPVSQFAKKVGYIFQNLDAQFIKNTVVEEIYHSLMLTGCPQENIAQVTDDLLDQFGLSNYKNHYPLDLSMGEKRSLSLAIYFPFQPEVLVLDEPTMGLDFKGTVRLMDMMNRLKRSGTTIIIITHEMRLLTDFVDRVIILTSGHLEAIITPRELFSSTTLLELLSIIEPPVVALSRRLANDCDDCAATLCLTPQELCKSLDR